MTQPDKTRDAPMTVNRQTLIDGTPCGQFKGASLLPPTGSLLASWSQCYTRVRRIRSLAVFSLAQRALSDGVAPTPLTVARSAWRNARSAWRNARSAWRNMDRNWLEEYPPGVPADIDADSYASLRDIFEEACNAQGHSPAFTNMGATLS